MIRNVTLATITMNAGKGIPGSTVRHFLREQSELFSRIIVVDGDLTNEAKEFYSQFSNVEAIDSPWTDSYVQQYRKISESLRENEWCFYADDDECMDAQLYYEIGRLNLATTDKNIFYIPCILHLTEDGKKYYPCENRPKKEFTGQWVKRILFKKTPTLDFRYGGSHVAPTHGSQERWGYVPQPYHHYKTLESFVFNDVTQAFLSPEGQGYNPAEAAQFKSFTKAYKSTKEFKQAMIDGTWPPFLQMFAWKNRKQYGKPISRLAWSYFVLCGHKMIEPDPEMNWQHLKQFVLGKESMEIFNKNKLDNNFVMVNNND